MNNATGLVLFKDKFDKWRIVLVIINSRSRLLKVSTPGGVKDRKDKSLFATFKREYFEETGMELPRLFSIDGKVPYIDNFQFKTRIYFSHLADPRFRIKYDSSKVLHNETLGLIMPKLEHIRERIFSTPSDKPVIITTGGNNYILRHCVRESLKSMFLDGILRGYY